jgi:hypothetical protein
MIVLSLGIGSFPSLSALAPNELNCRSDRRPEMPFRYRASVRVASAAGYSISAKMLKLGSENFDAPQESPVDPSRIARRGLTSLIT